MSSSISELSDSMGLVVEKSFLYPLSTPESQADKFFKYWTLKESLLKAMGLGLIALPRDVFFSLIPRVTVGFTPKFASERPEAWQFRLFDVADGYQGAIAVKVNQSFGSLTIQHRQAIELLPSNSDLPSLLKPA